MLILIKMITQKTTIITLLCFWSHIICQEEDIIGVPLLTQLHLAKAKAMHNLAIAKAKLHPTSHLLLQSNPMYTDQDSLSASAGYNNLKNSANLNSGNLDSKPFYDLKDVQTHDYSHPIHYELPKEDTFSKNDPLSIFNARNKEIDQSTDKANAGPFEFDIQNDVQTQTTTEHPILLLEDPTTNENQNLSDSNSTILKINRIHTTEPGTPKEHLQMINSAHDNPSSDLKNIKNDINMGKYKLPPSQDTLPVNSDLPLFFDLKTLEQSSSSDTEINDTLDKSRNLKAIQGINKQNNSYEHRKFVANNENLSKIEEELSLKTKSNSHVLPNARSQPVGFLKKSNDDFDEHNLKFASSNSDITRTLNSNTDSHPEFGMLRNNDKSRYMNSKNVQHLSESTSNSERYDSNLESSLHSSAESSEETTSHVLPIKSNVDNVENNHTDSKSENINVSTTDKANIVTETFETQPSSYPPESKTESNTAKNGDHRNRHKPKLSGDFLDEILDDDLDLLSFLAAPKPSTDPRNMEHTASIIQNFGNVKDYTKMPMQILLPVESTTANSQEINPIVQDEFNLKQNMYLDRVKDLPSYANMKERLLGKELQNSEMFSDHFGPTPTGNVNEEQYQTSRTLSQSNKYDQQNLEQIPAITINDDKLRHSMKMNENPSDTQRTTNYEIYSKNRNFNNRFRDEQFYPWSLNMENYSSALKSPHTEDILGNSTPQQFDYKRSEDNAFGHSFHRLKQCIKQIHEKDLNSYPKKYTQQSIPETKFQARENENKNLMEGNQSYYPERVGTYLLHFPPNQAYVGERYRREIRNLKQKKSIEKETRRQLPLISLIIDPYAKLDVPKTIKNFGTVTKNSLEDKKAPMYYLSNMLASMRNAGLATMMIPPQDMIIPADYKIINKKAIDNEIVGSPKFAGNSLEKGGVFHKVGSIMRQSIESGQEALQHVNDVAQNARRIVSSTRESLPRLFVPYAKVPEVTKARTKNKLTLIAPRFADVGEDSTSHEDDYVKVGHVLDALSLSHPQQKDVGTMKITIQPKSKEPRLQSRFGDTNESENPGYYVVKNHLEGNALNPEEVHEIIDIFHTIKEVAGAKSLKDFLKNVRTQLENCTHSNSIIQLNSTSNEKVGTNLKFTKEMIEPFMGILKETSQEHHRKKLKRAAPQRNYYNAENAAFANFLAGYEIVSSINPEVYRTYFHEPLKINHSEGINLKEIQHEIKNSKLLIVPPLLSSKRDSEKQNGTTFFNDGDEGKTG